MKTTLAAAPNETSRTSDRNARPPQRSLVRAAITLLVQQPSLALAIEPPWPFAALRQPGVALLVELVELGRARPDLTTGALLEHFAQRDEVGALQKLAVADFPGGVDEARAEFVDAIRQLERQTRQQRIEELQADHAQGGLADAGKEELRQLLAARTQDAR